MSHVVREASQHLRKDDARISACPEQAALGGSGSNHVCDYHCVNGGIGQTGSSVLPESSMASIEILSSLPISTTPSDATRFVRSPPLLLMRIGQDAKARDTLKALQADPAAPDGVRGRAGGLLTRLGEAPAAVRGAGG